MEIFLGVFILILAITGMSIGVIFNRNPYQDMRWFIPEGTVLCGNDPKNVRMKAQLLRYLTQK